MTLRDRCVSAVLTTVLAVIVGTATWVGWALVFARVIELREAEEFRRRVADAARAMSGR
jgi:hypothetical protein